VNNMGREEKLIEGHRLIRNFQRKGGIKSESE